MLFHSTFDRPLSKHNFEHMLSNADLERLLESDGDGLEVRWVRVPARGWTAVSRAQNRLLALSRRQPARTRMQRSPGPAWKCLWASAHSGRPLHNFVVTASFCQNRSFHGRCKEEAASEVVLCDGAVRNTLRRRLRDSVLVQPILDWP